MPRKGWQRLTPAELSRAGYSPTSERFRSPSGNIVSRRQYDNARYTDAGFRNRSDFERRHADPTYRFLIDRIARESGRPRKEIDKPGTTVTKTILAARDTGYGKRRAGRGLRSPMARALILAGLRDPGATYHVGATPPRAR